MPKDKQQPRKKKASAKKRKSHGKSKKSKKHHKGKVVHSVGHMIPKVQEGNRSVGHGTQGSQHDCIDQAIFWCQPIVSCTEAQNMNHIKYAPNRFEYLVFPSYQ